MPKGVNNTRCARNTVTKGYIVKVKSPFSFCDRLHCLTVVVWVHDTVLASAVDVTTNASMRQAANAALDALADDPEFISRNCDCKAQRSGKKAQKTHAKQAGYEDDWGL